MGEEYKVDAGGVSLACQASGDRDAPPMVLLHALGEQAGSWAPVTARFAAHYRVVAVDLRGHGRSDWPGAYSFQLMRDDVTALIDRLGLGKVVLAGHSMGGMVAYLTAMTRPDQVTGPSPGVQTGRWTSTGRWCRPSSARSTRATP
jgi:3-oxoadipate enol-lactonase